MNLVFSESAWEDYLHWQEQDKKLLQRINTLTRDIKRSPFDGIGKPEPLRGNLSGWWSRRINREHWLVYKATDDEVLIAQCRYHY